MRKELKLHFISLGTTLPERLSMDFSTPHKILSLYRKGFVGSICDPEDTAKLMGELSMPVFGAAAYDLYGDGEGVKSLPFKSLLKFDPNFGPSERQTTGDCVSHSTRNAVDITRAEAIYQSRSHMGQGMTCSGAARYVHEVGGLLIRKDYGDVDLSKYNSTLGSKKRIPKSIYLTEAKKHQVKTIS